MCLDFYNLVVFATIFIEGPHLSRRLDGLKGV